jgi:hypothetical protein
MIRCVFRVIVLLIHSPTRHEFIDPFRLLWPKDSSKIILTFHFYNIFFLKFIFHRHLFLSSFPSILVDSLPPFYGCFFFVFFPCLYFVVQSDFFCVVNHLLHTFVPIDPMFFIHLLYSVSRIDRCSRRGKVD